MHHHITGERHRQIVTQTLLAEFGGEVEGIAILEFLIRDLRDEIARVKHFEEQFIALLAVLAHQRLECFHCRRLYLLEAIELVHLLDGVEDIVTLGHLHRGEVARSFGNAWFVCHI